MKTPISRMLEAFAVRAISWSKTASYSPEHCLTQAGSASVPRTQLALSTHHARVESVLSLARFEIRGPVLVVCGFEEVVPHLAHLGFRHRVSLRDNQLGRGLFEVRVESRGDFGSFGQQLERGVVFRHEREGMREEVGDAAVRGGSWRHG